MAAAGLRHVIVWLLLSCSVAVAASPLAFKLHPERGCDERAQLLDDLRGTSGARVLIEHLDWGREESFLTHRFDAYREQAEGLLGVSPV